jgi:hypothetical protein
MIKHSGKLILSLVLSIGAGLGAYAASAVSSQMHALEQQEKTDLQNLSQQIADLKDKHQQEIAPPQQQLDSINGTFQSAMKQLKDQYADTRSHDDDELAALMDRIKPGYLSFYNEKKSSLANVNSREDQSIQGLRQQEDNELQGIREKYAAQRKSLQQESTSQRQAINSKFETEVKGLK